MARTIAGQAALYSTQRDFATAWHGVITSFMQTATSMLTQSSLERGGKRIIPKNSPQSTQVRAQIGDAIERLFVGSDYRSAFGIDGVTPQSPYARAINDSLINVSLAVIDAHARYMERNLPDDVISVLRNATGGLQEQIQIIPAYDPSHIWVDPSGYRLSDRIWRTGIATRAKIDSYLTNAIEQGLSSVEISKAMESYLQPDRALVRTWKPYWSDPGDRALRAAGEKFKRGGASFDGMRLARTEIARAHTETTYLSSLRNPMVDGWDWVLSSRHPKVDICDKLATVGMKGERLKDPYPLTEGVPRVVEDSHPQCVTPGQMVITKRGAIPIEQIQEGDYVLTHTAEYRRVLSTWSRQYSGKVYKIFAGGFTAELTNEHPVLTSRGWVNAENLQLSDQIYHTGIGAPVDLSISVSESLPSEIEQSRIPNSVFSGAMPSNTITLDSDFFIYKRKVKFVAEDGILLNISNPHLIKYRFNSKFNGTYPMIMVIAVPRAESPFHIGRWLKFLLASQAYLLNTRQPFRSDHFGDCCRIAHWVIDFPKFGNLTPRFGAFSRVIITRQSFPDLCDPCALSHSPLPVIFFPLLFNGLTTGFLGDTRQFQQLQQPSELNTQPFADFGCPKHLGDIKILEDCLIGDTVESLYLVNMLSITDFGAFLEPTFFAVGMLTLPTANTARVIEGSFAHDNLLLLSPECYGHGSGNPSVSEVANPAQAQSHYITINRIEVREYEGDVYNMHVDVDNTYTVNGVAVHNCICVNCGVVTRPRDEIVKDLRAQLESSPLTPANRAGFAQFVLGGLYRLIPAAVMQRYLSSEPF